MVDRRSVLKLGAASVAGAFVRVPGLAVDAEMLGAQMDRPSLLRAAVFAERFQQALVFAEEFERRQVATFSAGYDIAQLWYREGLPHHAPIAGLTDRVTLFCLEELARSAGMRVLYRVDHVIDEHGNAEHNAAGPASVVDLARKLPASGFGREVAVLATQFEFSEPSDTAPVKRTGPFAPHNTVALVSWVIA